MLGLLLYNPAWRDAPWNAAPITADYVAYAKATVRHFKKHVKYWEIWNEPDSKTYWQPQDDMAAYAQLLKAVYPAIKKEDPTAKVVIGGMTEAGPYSARRVYQKIGKNYFDIMNVHPYVDPNKPAAVQTMKGIYYSLMRVMQEFGDADKPIWFTEIGAPGVITPTRQNAWWHGTSPTEIKQAGMGRRRLYERVSMERRTESVLGVLSRYQRFLSLRRGQLRIGAQRLLKEALVRSLQTRGSG